MNTIKNVTCMYNEDRSIESFVVETDDGTLAKIDRNNPSFSVVEKQFLEIHYLVDPDLKHETDAVNLISDTMRRVDAMRRISNEIKNV